MGNGVQYTPLGQYLNQVGDQNKNVRGPYNAAKYMEKEAECRGYDIGLDPSTGNPRKMPRGGAVSKYYRGLSSPDPWWITAFYYLFDLDEEQGEELARRYAYGFRAELDDLMLNGELAAAS